MPIVIDYNTIVIDYKSIYSITKKYATGNRLNLIYLIIRDENSIFLYSYNTTDDIKLEGAANTKVWYLTIPKMTIGLYKDIGTDDTKNKISNNTKNDYSMI